MKKYFTVTNTLAYLTISSMTKTKRFIDGQCRQDGGERIRGSAVQEQP
jgi:hypothetical protein